MMFSLISSTIVWQDLCVERAPRTKLGRTAWIMTVAFIVRPGWNIHQTETLPEAEECLFDNAETRSFHPEWTPTSIPSGHPPALKRCVSNGWLSFFASASASFEQPAKCADVFPED